VHVAQSNGREIRSPAAKLLFIFAQLRDVLAAEDSTVVAQEDQNRGRSGPQCAELNLAVVSVRQRDVREPGT